MIDYAVIVFSLFNFFIFWYNSRLNRRLLDIVSLCEKKSTISKIRIDHFEEHYEKFTDQVSASIKELQTNERLNLEQVYNRIHDLDKLVAELNSQKSEKDFC